MRVAIYARGNCRRRAFPLASDEGTLFMTAYRSSESERVPHEAHRGSPISLPTVKRETLSTPK